MRDTSEGGMSDMVGLAVLLAGRPCQIDRMTIGVTLRFTLFLVVAQSSTRRGTVSQLLDR